MKNLRTLQRIVNDICSEIGRIDDVEQYRIACNMADANAEDHALMSEILHEAMAIRFQKDTKRSAREFLKQAEADV